MNRSVLTSCKKILNVLSLQPPPPNKKNRNKKFYLSTYSGFVNTYRKQLKWRKTEVQIREKQTQISPRRYFVVQAFCFQKKRHKRKANKPGYFWFTVHSTGAWNTRTVTRELLCISTKKSIGLLFRNFFSLSLPWNVVGSRSRPCLLDLWLLSIVWQ